jgi:8-oxo-dGTP pyrophosphatase MutT (NUDIX family)
MYHFTSEGAETILKRALLLSLLETHTPWNEHEGRMRDRMKDFVNRQPDCFDRSLLVGHITGSAWVLDQDQALVLLTHHCKLNKWLQLGGHADGEGDVLLVALREAVEESGLESIWPFSREIFDVDVHEIPAHANDPAHLHYDVRFRLAANPNQPLRVSSESKELAWVPLREVHKLTREESVLRMVEKSLAGPDALR